MEKTERGQLLAIAGGLSGESMRLLGRIPPAIGDPNHITVAVTWSPGEVRLFADGELVCAMSRE